MNITRWDGSTKANREQVVLEWELHFSAKLHEAVCIDEQEGISDAKLAEMAAELAEDVVKTIEQAVRANKGRGLPE